MIRRRDKNGELDPLNGRRGEEKRIKREDGELGRKDRELKRKEVRKRIKKGVRKK